MVSKKHILGLIEDSISDLMYYDRKDDEDCPRGEIEEAVELGKVTIEEMVAAFEKHLREALDGR